MLTANGLGLARPSLQRCCRLVSDELFLLSEVNPASFDSRLFRPVSHAQNRVHIVCNRIIRPDTSSLLLDNLLGTDPTR
ncbi:hypothetical protein CAL22_11960 [Bordetella genomosp. 12]|uniref:Uncharacterized protein n=1 Tax=Bordetella genomosp. 12 TaxID=463035 RepID=A0A261VLY6_9BORD|nr:hypothetical protein CAL22_11960 [Bordetella genomosp. 12]